MLESGAGLEVLDGQLDGGVLAMEPVDVDDVTVEVGEERVVTPVGPQFLLCGVGEAGAANDHSSGHSFGALAGGVVAFGDFGFAVVGVGDRLPGVIGDADDRGVDRTTLVLIAIV